MPVAVATMPSTWDRASLTMPAVTVPAAAVPAAAVAVPTLVTVISVASAAAAAICLAVAVAMPPGIASTRRRCRRLPLPLLLGGGGPGVPERGAVVVVVQVVGDRRQPYLDLAQHAQRLDLAELGPADLGPWVQAADHLCATTTTRHKPKLRLA
jgi:hypothetical protein